MAGKGISEFRETWQPPDRGGVPECYPLLHPEMTFRWLNEHVRAEIGMEYWMTVPHVGTESPDPSLRDYSPPGPDGTVRRGDNFLGMMTKDLAAQRTAYYNDKAEKRKTSVTEARRLGAQLASKQGVKSAGGAGGGKVTIGEKRGLTPDELAAFHDMKREAAPQSPEDLDDMILEGGDD